MPAKRKATSAAKSSPKPKKSVKVEEVVVSPARRTRGRAAAAVVPVKEEVEDVATEGDDVEALVTKPASPEVKEENVVDVKEVVHELASEVKHESQDDTSEVKDIDDEQESEGKPADESLEKEHEDVADESLEKEQEDVADESEREDEDVDDGEEYGQEDIEDNGEGSDYGEDEEFVDVSGEKEVLDSGDDEGMDEQEEIDGDHEVEADLDDDDEAEPEHDDDNEVEAEHDDDDHEVEAERDDDHEVEGRFDDADVQMDEAEEPHTEDASSLEGKAEESVEENMKDVEHEKMDTQTLDNAGDLKLDKAAAAKVEGEVEPTLAKEPADTDEFLKSDDESAFSVRFRVLLDELEDVIPHLHDYCKMETNIFGSFIGNKVVAVTVVYTNEHKDQVKKLEELKINGKILANFKVESVAKPHGLTKVTVGEIPITATEDSLKSVFYKPDYFCCNPIQPQKKFRTVTLGFLTYTEAKKYVESQSNLMISKSKVSMSIDRDTFICGRCYKKGHNTEECRVPKTLLNTSVTRPPRPQAPLPRPFMSPKSGLTQESDRVAQQMVKDMEDRMTATMTEKIMAKLSEKGHDTSDKQLSANLAQELRQMTDDILKTSNMQALFSASSGRGGSAGRGVAKVRGGRGGAGGRGRAGGRGGAGGRAGARGRTGARGRGRGKQSAKEYWRKGQNRQANQ